MSNQIRTGVIGVGRIGKLHAENLHFRIPGATVAAIADVRVDAAKEVASALGVKKAVGEYKELLKDRDIDAVIICSSTDTHADIIEEAAQAGKQIFCEKPIDFDLGRIDRALEQVEKHRVKLQVGFMRRFDPTLKRVRQQVRDGKIGEPHILRITSRDPEPPPLDYIKVSGGIFLDMTSHDFDIARFLIGEDVEELYTAAGVMVDPRIGEVGDLDTAVITLKFANGVIGTIDDSRKSGYNYDQRVEVLGSTGMVSTTNISPTHTKLSVSDAVHEDLPHFFFIERYSEAYVNEMADFIDCLRSDSPPPVTGLDGRISVVMGMAARLSYDHNRPVKLSEI
jgi:myo-inositol 2-dehydrogenase/D-chiro-inositol 1-dehydrogenase